MSNILVIGGIGVAAYYAYSSGLLASWFPSIFGSTAIPLTNNAVAVLPSATTAGPAVSTVVATVPPVTSVPTSIRNIVLPPMFHLTPTSTPIQIYSTEVVNPRVNQSTAAKQLIQAAQASGNMSQLYNPDQWNYIYVNAGFGQAAQLPTLSGQLLTAQQYIDARNAAGVGPSALSGLRGLGRKHYVRSGTPMRAA